MTGVGFGPLACAANMMSAFGRDVEDQALARGMELPFLFASTPDGYQAGVRLCTTARMNQYLTPLGLMLLEQGGAREQLPGLLASVRTASVALSTKTGRHSAVYMGMSGNRLRFVLAKTADSDVPDELLLTKAMLLRRVDEHVRVCIMEECTPVSFDPKPLLLESLRVQTEYHNALVQLWTRQIQHDEIKPVFPGTCGRCSWMRRPPSNWQRMTTSPSGCIVWRGVITRCITAGCCTSAWFRMCRGT